MAVLELSIFADYFQFYLQDDAPAPDEVNFPDAWTEEAVERQLAAVPGALAVGTAHNMTVPVVIEVLSAPPNDDPTVDLVTEAPRYATPRPGSAGGAPSEI